ncbi:DUF4359 domain-containing protein [Paenibacillus sp. FSL H7-0331]|uniref:DUF4359 domain-containing protein n=1 Tax=Paenibacillus sp. FSL H7-0331 TaxID=1920421 RepID=UPI0015C2F863|nr:DUF4359 domain-containing protein [Paenibacillus sp. FSL H7-0331]
MKKIIILAIIVFLLAITNPSKSEFTEWALSKLQDKGNTLSNFGVSLIGKPIIENSTTVHNYIIFSTFETMVLNKKVTTLGVLKNFISLKE